MRTKKQGFTLIEVLMSILLGGLVLLSSVSLLVTFTQNWIARHEETFFEEHINGIYHFLFWHLYDHFFEDQNSSPVFDHYPKQSLHEDPLLCFQPQTYSPILSASKTQGKCLVYLKKESKGLYLYYYYPQQEQPELGHLPVYKTRLSPWVKKLQYWVFDPQTKAWTSFESLFKNRGFKEDFPPSFLELHLSYKKQKKRILVPLRSSNVLVGDLLPTSPQ